MGLRGTKPLPEAILKLRGTYDPSKRRGGQDLQLDTLSKIPDPPMPLNKVGQELWTHCCSVLIAHGILSSVDTPSLCAYCMEMETYFECQMIVADIGRTFMTPSGYRQQVPEVGIATKSLTMALKLAQQFGLTPSARAAIGQFVPLPPEGGKDYEDGMTVEDFFDT